MQKEPAPKSFHLLFLSIVLVLTSAAQPYEKLHRKAIVADTHNDILETCLDKGYSFDQALKGKTHSDIQRFKEGGVDVQVFSVWCDGKQKDPFNFANRMIDTLYATIARNPDKIALVNNSKELKKAVHDKKLAAMIGVEGGHMMEADLGKLDSLYKRGTRYMTLTWNNSTSWATSAMEETIDSLRHQPKGMNDFGKQVVQRMNQLGMMVDLSHVGEQTFWDAMAATTKPVLISHSCVYNICPVFRNLKDDQIKAIGKNNGVIQLNFFSGFLDSSFEKKSNAFQANHKAERDSLLKLNPDKNAATKYINTKYAAEREAMRPPLSLLLDHLDYVVNMIGADHVGLGGDFDGVGSTAQQLDDVTTYPIITKALLERGYSKKQTRKILGGNFLRVLKANEN
ncbi:MAG: dipeptidase [Bacteroidota bacterium]